ncbi:Electron transfer flavoprotein-ubiquinone oxidoreductase [Pseudovibrio axinellae]|uniref:Electron transfer flavoprotein-ubiquinone oxidoreductase n=1 Tax=Pseudovibrio axinellae TaxID=989403 RepID=A0A165YGC3_9HYPH|nr:electron transfer flavoprotein-ubiquinone oxidoreductase [Pseudovibrio axinellae]KZL18819.1 Electron transfer flavoprotein-ubiquinone oxidoreductase [Pseudovibrio axinellae]SEP91674.1 electron-transferring-flavoprotein dehydrogenase [Pseudovibrio axinellae]
MSEGETLPERESMEFDVVVVGGGPAGLSAAIRIKQQAQEKGEEVSVVVLEKGSEIGAHVLSGAVIDPVGIDKLIPDWRQDETAPIKTPVTSDQFNLLGPSGGIRLPNFLMPKLMNNHGNYIVSLGNVCRWLAEKAEALGVEIYPGFAAAEMLYDDAGKVIGVATGDMGVARDGSHKDGYMRGMALLGKYTLIAEGVRGSLAKTLIDKFDLDRDCDHPKFGIGIKELWEVEPSKHKPGLVKHSMGWPLDSKTQGGSFLYHLEDNQVAVGFVVNLNYQNPHLSPFDEFQRFKTHPGEKELFEGGKRISYGARAISEGGYQSVPKLSFPGGLIIGCSAGLVNVPRIKGSHNAVLSGIMAADMVVESLGRGEAHQELDEFDSAWRSSEIGADLRKVRNVKPLQSKLGSLWGMVFGGFDMWTNELLGFSFFGTVKHGKSDAASLKAAKDCKKIDYPKPDGKISFDKLSSVFLSNTNHEEDQPIHLKLRDEALQKLSEHDVYDGPSSRYCPAGVYEWVEENGEPPRFQINAQNCVHCKTCDIKDPNGNITWTVPEGTGGPNYPNM